MLYVFHVDTGNMMTLDMSLTTESVQTLKEHLQKILKIPADMQVLLISGGECLDSTKRVCSYSAGTDTNPLYLFSRCIEDISHLPDPVLEFREENELLEKEKKYKSLPPSFLAVTKRAQLAQQFSESAIHLLKTCEALISDQHNQHQGWAAVMANFEDVLAEFKYQFTQLECDFKDYMQERERFLEFLVKFKEDIQVLRRIPLLPKLLRTHDKSQYVLGSSQTSEGTTQNTFEEMDDVNMTLFDWIGREERGNVLELIYEHCDIELEHYNQNEFSKLSAEASIVLNSAEQPAMKEIGGMGSRLYGLDQLMHLVKKKVQEQVDLASSVAKHESQVQNLKDPLVLPNLCASHSKQLSVMANNQSDLMEAQRKCTKAKGELNKNLNRRLRWVILIQNNMQKIGDLVDVFSENLAKLRYQLGVLEQVGMAPAAYLSCIAEIVRRRSFSQAFLVWASELACRLLTIHNEEVARRKDFQAKFEGHFIQTLFPGLEDLPPDYGTQAPSYFDTGLPKLTEEDVEFLKKELPEMVEYLDISDPPYSQLFKSMGIPELEKLEEPSSAENKLQPVDNQCEITDNMEKSLMKEGGRESSLLTVNYLPHLKDVDRGCESETDTEEFEKVGQSPLDLNFDKEIPSPRRGTQDASTLTEGNLEISRGEYDKLKSVLSRLETLTSQSIVHLRSELSNLKLQYTTDKSTILQYLQVVGRSIQSLCLEHENHERMIVHQMSTDHSNEINDFRKLAQVKNEEIKSLRSNNMFLEDRVRRINDDYSKLKEENDKHVQNSVELEKRISFLEMEKDKCVKEVTEKLNREHKNEIKTLQARFKLMTMERTPSEGSLEKTLEFSSLTNHESIINQMTENFELEKEKAVKETIDKETEKWENVISELKDEFEVQKNFLLTTVANKINEEKDKEIEVLKNREQMLMEEISHYTTTIGNLTTTEVDDHNLEMMDKIEVLENEKRVLSSELQKMKTDRVDMAASVGAFPEGKMDSATSPIKQRKSLTKSLSVSSGKINKLSIDSLKHGDCVVVVWDEDHESFKVVQDSPVMYFLHSDCIQSLNLEISEGPPKRPNKFYCLGEYVDKEYCHARKSENRYKVPRGTRFFRVKVRPLERETRPPPSPKIDVPMTQSQRTSHRTSSGSTTDPEFHSLPSSPKNRSTKKVSELQSTEMARCDIARESDNKTSYLEDDSSFMTALYDIAGRNNDFSEVVVATNSDNSDSVR